MHYCGVFSGQAVQKEKGTVDAFRMLRLLSGDRAYHESHNAFFDALDELQIMRLLGHRLQDYIPL